MKILLAVICAASLCACSPTTTESASTADTTVAELDTTTFAETDDAPPEDASMYDADPGDKAPTGKLDGDNYSIFAQSSMVSVSSPFDFSLDSASLMDLLGEETRIEATIAPPGEDEMGPYDGYTYYELKSGKTTLTFYSYSGKHTADIYTDKLTVGGGIAVGMSLDEFIEKMFLDEEAKNARSFTINDDYGSMSFYFDTEDKLININVYYEEGD